MQRWRGPGACSMDNDWKLGDRNASGLGLEEELPGDASVVLAKKIFEVLDR